LRAKSGQLGEDNGPNRTRDPQRASLQALIDSYKGIVSDRFRQKYAPDPHGIVVNFPLGALAHVGLARAYALSADTAN
jgi:hypothetical protein